jgi:phage-related protein (TIGR01555 family)
MNRRNKRRISPKNNAVTRSSFADGFQNFAARVGIGTDNPATGNINGIRYGNSFLSRQRKILDNMFRTSWVVNKTVVVVAEDMTKRGIEIEASWDADKLKIFKRMIVRQNIFYALQSAIQWSRLYGGAVAFMMIDGQDASTPLNMDTIASGQFKGLRVFDRWSVDPDLNNIIAEYGPDYGKPEYYTVNVSGPDFGKRIHHSRVLLFTGLELPEEEALSEMGWGGSIVETMHDRLVAFDSTTLGASQLVYRAYIRTIKINKFREVLAKGGAAEEALMRQMNLIRKMQVNEGLTLLDSEDDFVPHQYTFAGLNDVLLSFGEQLAGATGIPLVRLFGQSPAGLNSTGESDLRTYYDTVKASQEIDLRQPILKICDVMSRSVFGEPLPDDFWFEFAPLWELSDMEKADIASKDTVSITAAYDMGLISRSTALKELKASGAITGRWDKITDEEIEEEENAPPSGELVSSENLEPLPANGESGDLTKQEISLNGAQVTSMVEIVAQVAAGLLPRDSGINMLMAAFTLSNAQAEKIMGSVGHGFVPSTPAEAISNDPFAATPNAHQ